MERYLPIGYELHLGEKLLTINSIKGHGSQCAAYEASEKTANIGVIRHIIKEYNPLNVDIFRSKEGFLSFNDDRKYVFNEGLKRLEKSVKIQNEIRKEENLTNYVFFVPGIYKANGTLYIDMPLQSGNTYDNRSDSSLLELICRIRTIANSVKKYHELGYLLLDLKPDNLFFLSETTDLVLYFDFDSVVRKDNIINEECLSCTLSWAAPELFCEGRKKDICELTDIYSIGEILFYKLFGRHSSDSERRFYSKYDYSRTRTSLQIESINPKVLGLLDIVFHKTLSSSIKGRFSSDDSFISFLDQIIELLQEHKVYLQSNNSFPCDYFIGRESELEELRILTSTYERINVYGIGGIGKSELLKHFARRFSKDYDNIVWCIFPDSWMNLVTKKIASNLVNFPKYEESDKDCFFRVINHLKNSISTNTLFIVDNINSKAFISNDEQEYRSIFLGLECKMIFSSREVIESLHNYKLENIADSSNLTDLFFYWYMSNDISKELSREDVSSINKIVDYVSGHTLALELIAKQCNIEEETPTEKYKSLLKSGIGGNAKVHVFKDGKITYCNPLDFIVAMFSTSKCTDLQIRILFTMSLMPVEGIKQNHLLRCVEEGDINEIDYLIRSGWLKKQNGMISMHPLIAEAITKDCKDQNQLAKIECFLEEELETIFPDSLDDVSRSYYWGMVHGVFRYILYNELTKEDNIRFLSKDFWKELSDNPFNTELIYNYALGYCKKNKCGQIEDTFSILSNLIDVFADESGISKTQEVYEKAQQVYLNANLMALDNSIISNYSCAKLYSRYAGLLGKLRYFAEAHEAYEWTLALLNNESKKDNGLKADALLGIGELYLAEFKYNEANKFFLESLSIVDSVFGEDSIQSAIRYKALSDLKSNQELYDEAEKFIRKNIEIYEKIHGESNYRTYSSYNRLSEILSRTHRNEESVDVARKALSIYEKKYGKNTLDYARACVFLSEALMYDFGKFFNEIEQKYFEAINVTLDLFGGKNYYAADYKARLGYLYMKCNMFDKAQKEYEESNTYFLCSDENKLYIIRNEYMLGKIYEETGRLEEALDKFERIYSVCLEDNDDYCGYKEDSKDSIDRLKKLT